MSAFGKSPFKAGAEHIAQINEDCARVRFAKALLSDEDLRVELTEMESDFLIRIEAEHDKTVPDIFSGDRNICDKLKRKYAGRLA